MTFKPYEFARAFQFGLRALGRRYSYREIAARLARHPHAGSLLAIAELAPSFGTEVTAVRCDLGDLDSECAPVMLQLQGGGSSGSALVVAVEGDQFTVLDDRGVPCLISRSELDRWATGVAVLLETSPGPSRPERAYYLHRLREMPTELIRRLSRRLPLLSGVGGGMRLLALVLLGTSVILALQRAFSSGTGILASVLTAIATLGASLSYTLLMISRGATLTTSRPPLSQRLCGSGGGLLDCDSVLHSRWASIGPWTLASLGTAWFLSLLAAFGWARIGTSDAGTGVLWLALSLLLASPVSLFLVLVQIWPMRRLCPLCMAIHLAVLAGATAGWHLLSRLTLGELVALWPAGLLQTWLFSLALGVLMPWLRDADALASLSSDLTTAAATPLGSLALTLANPPLVSSPGVGFLCWGDAQSPLVVDGFVNPTCSSCGAVLSELIALTESHGDRIRLVIHLVAKDGSRKSGERSLLLALLAIASARGHDAALEAFWTIKRDPEPWLRKAAAGAGQVGARLADCRQEEIDGALPMAQEALEQAGAAAIRAHSGLPFILVSGRRFPAAVGHLGALVSAHYPLLLASFGIAPGGRPNHSPDPHGARMPDSFG